MSFLADVTKTLGTDAINTFGDIDLGRENVNGAIANATLLTLLLTAFRGHLVKGRTSFDDEYDYIIIGGGTAGAIMASRLSQHPCVKVLLLEAGGEQPLLSSIPGISRIFLGSEIDWSYYTMPQKHCCFGQNENRCLWNNGKVLGGGSTINAMYYVRGNKHNYDDWERVGAKGWSYKDVFPYFLKLEDNGNILEEDPGYHRQGGPMGAEKSRYNSKLKKHVLDGMLSLGFPLTDSNGRRQFGIYDLQGTIRNQERCSTATAYLKPAKYRPNLHIVTRAFVRKILIKKDENGKNRAFAVVVEHKKKIRVVRLRTSGPFADGMGEIILSNGAIRTPQTLMLSGIGPRDQLEKFRIPVIVDLPGVGKNLMDHNSASLLYEINPLLRNALNKQIAPEDIIEYLLFRRGPLCSITQSTIIAFTNGPNNTSPPYDFPMQQIYFFDYNTEDAVRTLNLRQDLEDKVFLPYLLKPVYLCTTQLLQPFSRGEITLNSIDPNAYPNINPNYYADERDVHFAVQGMKICEQVANTPAMQKIKAKLVATKKKGYPGCTQFEGDQDKYLGCIARSFVQTIYHYSGTAKMGDPADPEVVVDPQLKVIGVDKLRVISAAVMPIITSGNTNVPTMMIAEKAYDMMKDAIQCPSTLTIYKKFQVADTG